MKTLELQPSSAVLTKTVSIPNPSDPANPIISSYLCGYDGSQLPAGSPGLPIYRDLISGDTYVRIAEVIPTGKASADVDLANYLNSLKPIHYTNTDGSVRGYFVVAPDFNKRDDVAAAA